MRCPDCNKFVSYDDTNEPETDAATVDEEGRVDGNVRIYLACSECGTELKEATFDLLNIDYTAAVKAHRDEVRDNKPPSGDENDDEHELEIEVEAELTSRTEGKGRGMRTFYGYHATAHVKCSCGHEFDDQETSDEIRASQMDELT